MGANSGDFSGATDNLRSSVSKLILRFLLQCLPHGRIGEIIEGFCDSKIEYSYQPLVRSVKAKDIVKGKKEPNSLADLYRHYKCTEQGVQQQTNGQLMGHVLSFPVLCLANYLIFKWTYRVYNNNKYVEYMDSFNPLDDQFNFKEEPIPVVKVNGDDILFCCLPEIYELWKKETAKNGFFPSVGKNLFSPEIAQINSELFDIRFDGTIGEERVREIRRVPILNMGILVGRGKGRDPSEVPGTRICKDVYFNELSKDNAKIELPSLGANLSCLQSSKYFDFEKIESVYWNHRPKTYAIYKKYGLSNYHRADLAKVNFKENCLEPKSSTGLYARSVIEPTFDLGRFKKTVSKVDISVDPTDMWENQITNSLNCL